jgi:hypothetical protein
LSPSTKLMILPDSVFPLPTAFIRCEEIEAGKCLG